MSEISMGFVGRQLRQITDQDSVVGIYGLTFPNQKRYIGSSKHMVVRISDHLRALRGGTHNCPAFQSEFNKWGEENITILFLEKCLDGVDLREIEQVHIECASIQGWLLNISDDANHKGIKRSAATRKRISVALKGIPRSTKGKTYAEIYGTDNPANGFKAGDANVSRRPIIRARISASLREPGRHGAHKSENRETFVRQAALMRAAKQKKLRGGNEE